MESINELVALLGTDNAETLKKNIVDIITEQFRSDLELSDQYLFSPSILEDMTDEILDEVKQEIKEIIKEKLMAEAMMKLGNI